MTVSFRRLGCPAGASAHAAVARSYRCGVRPVSEDGAAAGRTKSPSDSASAGEPQLILITTRMTGSTVKILDGSTIGDAPFCSGGTASDTHGTGEIGLVDRTISCQDGTLRMGFDPQVPVGHTQSGPWRIIRGTGVFEGWHGSGEMVIRYDASDTSEHPTKGRERFTGTVTQ